MRGGWASVVAAHWRLTLWWTAGKSLPGSRGKHGADLNLAVKLDAVPPHRAGHACGAIIAAIVAFVHVMSINQGTASPRPPGCSCVQGAAAKR